MNQGESDFNFICKVMVKKFRRDQLRLALHSANDLILIKASIFSISIRSDFIKWKNLAYLDDGANPVHRITCTTASSIVRFMQACVASLRGTQHIPQESQ